MSYTLGEAAKAVGFSKPTLSRAIKNGKLSAKRLDDGSYQIDPAELERWKDGNGHRNGSVKRSVTPKETPETGSETPDSSALQIEVATLREQLRSAETARGFLEERVTDLQGRAERAEAKEDKLLALIADLRELWQNLMAWMPPPDGIAMCQAGDLGDRQKRRSHP